MDLREAALGLLGSFLPVSAILAFAIPLAGLVCRSRRLPWAFAAAASLLAAITSTLVYAASLQAPLVYPFGGWPPPIGISYEVDAFNGTLGLLTAWVMLAIVAYSRWYEAEIDDPSWYYVMLIGLEIGLLGCTYTGDAFNLFVMIEVLSISAYGLVAFHKERGEALEAASKYSLIGAVATNMYFLALVIIYGGYSTLNMADLSLVAGLLMASPLPALLAVSLSLWVFTYKSALFPNHFWLPDAHPEAPTPVSAALSGLVVNVGVYASMRFLYTIFGYNGALGPFRDVVMAALVVLGATSAIIGALMMMLQRDLKRLLAYSTISHIGLIYMVGSLGFVHSEQALSLALSAAVAHIFAHSLSKSTLFMASGVFIREAHSRDLDALRGVGRLRPVSSLATALSFFNLAGFVPMLGFFSKLAMYQAFVDAGLPVLAVVLIAASALSIPGYVKALYSLVFAVGRFASGSKKVEHVDLLLLAMSLVPIALGVLFAVSPSVFRTPASSLTQQGTLEYISAYLRVRESLGGGLRG